MTVTSFLRRKWIVCFILISTLSGASAQTNDKKTNQIDTRSEDEKLLDDIRSRFFRDNQLLQQYFQDGFLQRMDKMLQDQSMDSDAFKQMQRAFDDDPFFQMGALRNMGGEWIREKEGMTYLIDAEMSEGGKFDVKIKDGQVSVEADLERKLGKMGIQKSTFKQSFPVPKGCDSTKMKVEKRDEKIAIFFPWKEEAGLKI